MIKKIKILIVDDDEDILKLLNLSFKTLNIDLLIANDGTTALKIANKKKPEIIILDINMPDMEGTDVCKILRETNNCHIIFLSANDAEYDKVLALEVGGDDYITKPFSTRVLNAKIRSIIRRLNSKRVSTKNSSISIGLLKIDKEQHLAFWNNVKVELTAIEFNILYSLLSNPNKVFNKDQLISASYVQNISVSYGTIDSHIGHIRSKFKGFNANPIKTIHGIGYQISSCQIIESKDALCLDD